MTHETSPKHIADSFSAPMHKRGAEVVEAIETGGYKARELRDFKNLLIQIDIPGSYKTKYDARRAQEAQDTGMQLIRHGVWENLTSSSLQGKIVEMSEEAFSQNVHRYIQNTYEFHKDNPSPKEAPPYVSLQDARTVILANGLTGNFFGGRIATGIIHGLFSEQHAEIIQSAQDNFTKSLTSWMLDKKSI